MNNQERFDILIERLEKQGYRFFIDNQGFVIQHLTNEDDISWVQSVSDLIELIELIEWREQRKT